MSKPLHTNYCTLLRNEEDRDILTRKGFDVNMRLFETSQQYRGIVLSICSYLKWCAQTEKDGYKKPHGYSGANAGIPFNIIALADGTVMINPEIVDFHGMGYRESLSNCGSLMLKEPIKIRRFTRVTVEYFSMDGEKCSQTGYLPTVQHEIDHNLGILITDRKVIEHPTLIGG
jgi:polypeptide deformylase